MSEIPKTVDSVFGVVDDNWNNVDRAVVVRVQILLDRIRELEESEAEYTTAWQNILDEPCEGDDRVHCTCVPSLKIKIRELERENKALRKLLRFNGIQSAKDLFVVKDYMGGPVNYNQGPTPDAAIDAALEKLAEEGKEQYGN